MHFLYYFEQKIHSPVGKQWVLNLMLNAYQTETYTAKINL